MGGGTASGANMMNFFVKTGWIGLWLSITATAGEGWYFYWGNEFARLKGCRGYADWLHAVWYPADRKLVPLLELFIVLSYPIYIAGTISGAATLLRDYPGVPYRTGVLLVTAMYLVLTVAGIRFLQGLGTGMTICIVFLILLVLTAGIPKALPRVIEIQRTHQMGEGYSYLSAVWLAFCAWGQQASLVNVSISTWTGLKSAKDLRKTVLTGVVLLLIVKCGMTVLLQGRWPGNLQAPIYILEASDAAGESAVTLLYPLLLAACFASTGPVMLYTQSQRWAEHPIWSNLKKDNLFRKYRFAVSAACFSSVSCILAQFDFHTITGVIQVGASWFWLILFAVPVSLICPIRVKYLRRKAESKKSGSQS